MEEELINKTLDLVRSSNRRMPAHYTSNGDRSQSFCIDFEPLNKDDDHNMASEAYYKSLELYSPDYVHVLRKGEDIMVGAYILTKLGGEVYIEKFKNFIVYCAIKDFGPIFKGYEETLSLPESIKYFNHCAEFGKTQAKT